MHLSYYVSKLVSRSRIVFNHQPLRLLWRLLLLAPVIEVPFCLAGDLRFRCCGLFWQSLLACCDRLIWPSFQITSDWFFRLGPNIERYSIDLLESWALEIMVEMSSTKRSRIFRRGVDRVGIATFVCHDKIDCRHRPCNKNFALLKVE